MTLIAVVDNEEAIRKAMQRLLRGAGLQAEAYADGSEFVASAETHPPDCVTGMQCCCT